MKRLLAISIMSAVAGTLSLAQMSTMPSAAESRALSVSFSGGALVPAFGRFDATRNINDLLETGPAMGVSLQYSVLPLWSLRGTYDFAYSNFGSKYRPAGKTPAFVAPMATVDLILRYGSAIGINGAISPYCFSGAGVYVWKFSEDGTCGRGKGNAMTSAEGREWKESSFGLHTGLGAEILLGSNVALFAEGQYRYVFSKNVDQFGNDFGNLGFVKLGAGVSYNFSL